MKPILVKTDLWNDHDTAGSLIQLAHTRLFDMAIDHMTIVAIDFENEFPFLAKQSEKIEYYSDNNGTEFGVSFDCNYSPEDITKLIDYSKKSLRLLFSIFECSANFNESLVRVFPIINRY
jgi:hypothetical protein